MTPGGEPNGVTSPSYPCRMGSSANAVVSPRLAIHGLDNLYVATRP
jgi:GMC oxidoreductase